MDSKYKPVNCDSYDELEALSIHREVCKVVFTDDNGERQVENGKIRDIFTNNHVEYLRMHDGKEIRLDKIESVNGKPFQMR